MDLILFSVFIFLLPFTVALMFLTRIKSHQLSTGEASLPPGRMGWPIIGETLEFYNAGRRGAPQKFITDRMQKFSSQIFTTSLLGESLIVFSGAAANKFFFSNGNKLVMNSQPRLINTIFPCLATSSVNEKARKLRQISSEFLRAESLKRYIEMMDTITKHHLETSWENQKDVVVFQLVKTYTLSLAFNLFLSVDDPTQLANFANFTTLVTSGLRSIPIDLPGTSFNKAIKAARLMKEIVLDIIKKRKIDLAEYKGPPMQDILSHLMLTGDEDIADMVVGLLLGSQTASHVITFVIKYLAEFPQLYNEVLHEQVGILKSKRPGELLNWDDVQKMRCTWNVAQEVMRVSPSALAQGLFRETTADFTYAGFSIPKGWMVYLSTYSTHMNPDCFPNPDKFDPSRFEGDGPAPYTYVPFGGGPRMCPGREYGRFQILVFMHNLITRFKWEMLIPDKKIVVAPLMPTKGLPIRLQPRVIRKDDSMGS